MAMKAWLEMSQDYESSEKLREAARLFHDAAERGNAWALVGLGTLYLTRNGPFPYNAGKAIELFRQAARMGEAEGAEMIAEMCASGEGVQKNWWLSRKWRRYARSIKFQQRNKKESLIELED
jgi:TPR repeat protein